MLSTILTFLLVLSILVLVHELGHFIVARLAGVWVEEFGFGIPPRIVGKKIGIYTRLNTLINVQFNICHTQKINCVLWAAKIV